MVDPPKRVLINELVCEGCGDCSKKSNCLSVVPVETEFGRKRQIDQSSCNKDFSCVKGFCPSFVTVHGGQLRKPKPAAAAGSQSAVADVALPEPALPGLDQPYGMLVTGIGGTGVVTIGAILGMAAHLEGKGCSVLDQAGLAQKGGAVTSHIRIAAKPDDIHAVRIAAGGAASGARLRPRRHRQRRLPVQDGAGPHPRGHQRPRDDHRRLHPQRRLPHSRRRSCRRKSSKACGGAEAVTSLDATGIATALLGDSIATNLFMLGFAYQKGLIPVSAEAIEQAIELNAVAVKMNPDAFRWGRRAVIDLGAVKATAAPATTARVKLSETLDEVIARRVELPDRLPGCGLCRPLQAPDRLGARRSRASAPVACTGLTEAVARNYFKLLAYKDEYEVARLYTDGAFLKRLGEQFEGDYKLEFHLAPPMLAETDPATGEPKKKAYRAVDAEGLPGAGPDEAPARHPLRPVRPHAGAEDGAPAYRRLREDAGRASVRPEP